MYKYLTTINDILLLCISSMYIVYMRFLFALHYYILSIDGINIQCSTLNHMLIHITYTYTPRIHYINIQ